MVWCVEWASRGRNLVPVHGHAAAAGAAGDTAASRQLAVGGRGDGTRASGTQLGRGLLEGEELLGAEAWRGMLETDRSSGCECELVAYPRSGSGLWSR